MKVEITFEELSNLVKNKYGKQLEFSRKSDNELTIAYRQKVFFKSIRIPVNIRVEKVSGDKIMAVYGGNIGVDAVISGALAYFRSSDPEMAYAIQTEPGHRINIDLSRLSKTRSITKFVSLDSFQVLETGIVVTANLH